MRWILMQEVSLQEYWNNIGTSNVLLVALLLLPHLWSTANKVSPRIASRHAGELAMDESGNITRTNTSSITLSPAGFDSCASFPIATASCVLRTCSDPLLCGFCVVHLVEKLVMDATHR